MWFLYYMYVHSDLCNCAVQPCLMIILLIQSPVITATIFCPGETRLHFLIRNFEVTQLVPPMDTLWNPNLNNNNFKIISAFWMLNEEELLKSAIVIMCDIHVSVKTSLNLGQSWGLAYPVNSTKFYDPPVTILNWFPLHVK